MPSVRTCSGTSWTIVLVTPESRRLKFGAITSIFADVHARQISRRRFVWNCPSGRGGHTPGQRNCTLHDLVAARAAGRIDLDRVADFLADQRARDRRGDGDAARLHIGFLVADDLVGLLFLGVLVDERRRWRRT